MNNDINLNR